MPVTCHLRNASGDNLSRPSSLTPLDGGVYERSLRERLHEGWKAICIGTALCDLCSQQSRGVVQKCVRCGLSICQDCYLSGRLASNKNHSLDEAQVSWDPEHAETSRRGTGRRRMKKHGRGVAKTIPSRSMPRRTREAATQTQIRTVYLTEEEDAANILISMMAGPEGHGEKETLQVASSDLRLIPCPRILYNDPDWSNHKPWTEDTSASLTTQSSSLGGRNMQNNGYALPPIVVHKSSNDPVENQPDNICPSQHDWSCPATFS